MFFFNDYKVTTRNGKHVEVISDFHVACYLCDLLSPSRGPDSLFFFGFDRNYERRQRKLTNNRTIKGKYYVKNKHRAIFGFAEWQENATNSLKYTQTLIETKTRM